MLVRKKSISKEFNPKNKEIIQFDSVVAGKPNTEVCRVFLACLQLANMGNLMVVPPKVNMKEHENYSFGLQLLEANRKNGFEMENYLAPSLINH